MSPFAANAGNFLPHEHKDILFITDSGMETTMIFQDNMELREFASFELVNTEKGREYLKNYYRRHIDLIKEQQEDEEDDDGPSPSLSSSKKNKIGFVLESVLWRANPDWMKKLGYYDNDKDEYTILKDICRKSIDLLQEVQNEYPTIPMVKSGTIGPRSDGYVAPDQLMSIDEAKEYHLPQIKALKEVGANMISGYTLNYINEMIGITLACYEVGIPCMISFTVETNGCLLPSNGGQSIQEIIQTIDKETSKQESAAAAALPAYYGINCAHPTHFYKNLLVDPTNSSSNNNIKNNKDGLGDTDSADSWKERIGLIQANASKLSHAELDECEELDEGNPIEFGIEYTCLMNVLPNLNVIGGCCGTNHKHVSEILKTCSKPFFDSVAAKMNHSEEAKAEAEGNKKLTDSNIMTAEIEAEKDTAAIAA